MARLTYLFLFFGFVAVCYPRKIYTFNAEIPNELDMHSLPTPDKIITVDSKEELQAAVDKIVAEKKDSATITGQKITFLISF
ncbi:hypothetical protein QR680_004176 [Steinernema hermaphroditum]|uniref:Uncharacterized protein n=1 Tax=Steinernema hermaphroditum TaxID=289476 RepID=A0AA39LTK7_9BILA|nr:hypothetical protein QR680_004176 [Steinernema hermaphroditum]